MNWYRRYIFSQQITEAPLPTMEGVRKKSPGETYLNIGHMYDGDRYVGIEGLSLWAWSDRTGLYHVDYDEKKHKNLDFAHGYEETIDLPLSSRYCSGRFDPRTKRCSMVCHGVDPTQELIWKLQEIYGNDVEIVDFTNYTNPALYNRR